MADKLIVGCGYLGRRVAVRWLAQGHRVYGTTRSKERAAELAKLGIEPVVCDVLDAARQRALPVAETAVYCIGLDRSAGHSMREVYVDGLRNFLSSLKGWPDALVYISSTGVYGQRHEELVDEAAPTEPQEDSGRVVLDAEKLLPSDGQRPRITILRFAGIYGAGRVIRRQSIAAGEPITGDADKWLNLIQVEDGASAVVAAEERGTPGAVYNISDDRPLRRREFYRELARLLGAPEPRFVLPEPGAPLPPHERANRRIANRRMREELGVQLRYPSFAQGLPACLNPPPTDLS